MRRNFKFTGAFLCLVIILSVVLVVSINNISVMAYNGVTTLTEKELQE